MSVAGTLVGSRGTTAGNSATTGAGTTQATGSGFLASVSYDGTAGAISVAGDNKGNVYTALGTPQADGSGGLLRWYWCENGVGGASHTFTFTTASNNYCTVMLWEMRSGVGGKIARLDPAIGSGTGQVQGQATAQPWAAVATGALGTASDYVMAACGGNSGGTGSYSSSNTTILGEEPDAGSFWTHAVGGVLLGSSSTFSPSFTNATRGGGSPAALSVVAFIEVDAPSTGPVLGKPIPMNFGPALSFQPRRLSQAIVNANVTLSLTGQAATGAQGTMGNAHALTPTGAAATGAQGTLTPARLLGLTGQVATAAAGTLTPVRSITLTGIAATASPGSVLASIAAALSGIGAAMAAGTLAPGLTIPLVGIAATGAQGTITYNSGGNVTVSLTGQAATGAQGAFVPAITLSLAGLSSTAAPGTLTPARVLGLTGQAAAAAQGNLAVAAALQLLGAALATAQGFVSTAGNVTVALTGQQIAAAAGTLTPQLARALAGSAASAAQGSVVLGKRFDLTGQSLAASQGTLALLHALALLGIPATVSQGTVTAGNGLVINLTGLATAILQGTLAPSITATLLGMQASAVPGTISGYQPTPPTADGRPNPEVAGRYASQNTPRAMQSLSGDTLRVGSAGCRIGRFAWADPSGLVGNVRTGRLGFAVLQPQYWYGGYWSGGDLVLRPGAPVTLLTSGDVWTRFEGGCVAGAQVYADTLTGNAVSGYSATGEATHWYVVRSAGPGELAVISTTSRVQ